MPSEKFYKIVPGDIVRIAVGRGWRKAKVLRKDDDVLEVRTKDGKTRQISPDHVMTSDEAHAFSQEGGQTRIIRRRESPLEEANDSNTEEEQNSVRKFFGKL